MERALRVACVAALVVLSACLGLGASGGQQATPTSPPPLVNHAAEPPYPEEPTDVSVRFSSRICGGPCSAYSVEVCGNGTVYYVGYKDVGALGLHTYEVPRSNVTALVDAAYRTDFFTLDRKIGGDGGSQVKSMRVRIGDRSERVNYVRPRAERVAPALLAFESAVFDRTNLRRLVEGDDGTLPDERADELYDRTPFCG